MMRSMLVIGLHYISNCNRAQKAVLHVSELQVLGDLYKLTYNPDNFHKYRGDLKLVGFAECGQYIKLNICSMVRLHTGDENGRVRD